MSLAALCGCGRGNPDAPFPVASTTHRLTADGLDAPEGVPTWSADGTRMLFPRYVGGKWKVCMAEVATGRVTTLTDPPAGTQDLFPEMSPDGAVVAFVRRPLVSGDDSLMLAYVQGDSVRTLLTMHGIYRPKWRPDGRMILFGGLNSAGGFMYGFRTPSLASIAANDTLMLSRRYSWTVTGSVLKYEWNRSGTAFTCEYDISGSPRIAICEVLDPGVHVYIATDDFLTPDCGTQIKTNTEYSPSFTPDGTGVVFACNYVIGRVAVTGAANAPTEVDVGGGLRCDEFAAWSPDGQRLAIEAGNPVNSQLWMRHHGQANAVQMTAFPAGISRYFAAWSPDSRTIAVMERVTVGTDSTVQRISLVRGF